MERQTLVKKRQKFCLHVITACIFFKSSIKLFFRLFKRFPALVPPEAQHAAMVCAYQPLIFTSSHRVPSVAVPRRPAGNRQRAVDANPSIHILRLSSILSWYSRGGNVNPRGGMAPRRRHSSQGRRWDSELAAAGRACNEKYAVRRRPPDAFEEMMTWAWRLCYRQRLPPPW